MPNKSRKQHKPISIILTHAECHVAKPRKPVSILRVAEKCLRSGKLGKAFTTHFITRKNGSLEMTFDLLPKNIQRTAMESGQKYIKIFAPKSGLPIYAGNDTLEKIKKSYSQKRAGGLDKKMN